MLPLSPARVLFLFPGHGSQWPGMGRDLLETAPAFRACVDACDVITAREAGLRISDELRAPAERSRLGEIDVVQLALFVVEVALAAEWRARGLAPDAVLGTSLGEAMAAHLAGALSLEQALSLVAHRGRLIRELKPEGGALVVNVSAEEAPGLLAGLEASAGVSGWNGPTTTSFSGSHAALDELVRRAERRGVYAARIRVEYPAHSPLLEPLCEPLRQRLAGLAPGPTKIPMYSTVTGEIVGGEALDAGYWVRNLRDTVRVAPALERALSDGVTDIVECTPHPIFKKPVQDALARSGSTATYHASLRREQDGAACLAASEAELRARGALHGGPAQEARA